MTDQIETAYTPRAEYHCDQSTTHYQGCKCHEDRHAEEIAKLIELNEQQAKVIREHQWDELVEKIVTVTEERDELKWMLEGLRK